MSTVPAAPAPAESAPAADPAAKLEPATHELPQFRDIKAKKQDGTETVITACELKSDGKPLTAYWEGGRDKLPDLGWVDVKIEQRPHSSKPGVTVPFITSIAPAAAPEI